MTRKHFEALARAQIVRVCQNENPRFDLARFLGATEQEVR